MRQHNRTLGRRRPGQHALAWLVGGLAVGAALGWAAASRRSRGRAGSVVAGAPPSVGASPYGDEAAAIDARRLNSPLG